MKVITNQGEYATVTKVMSNHFEIRCDNGVTKLIERHRCEELVPISQLKACQEERKKATEQTMNLAVKVNKLQTELQEELNNIDGYKTPHAEGWKQCANKVINQVNEILR